MEGINKSIYSTFKRTEERKRDREWRRESGDNEQEETKRKRERGREKEKPNHRDMQGKGNKGERAGSV